MLNPTYLILPLLTAILFYGDYWISTRHNEASYRKRALTEASWWSAIYFLVGITNLSMFVRYF